MLPRLRLASAVAHHALSARQSAGGRHDLSAHIGLGRRLRQRRQHPAWRDLAERLGRSRKAFREALAAKDRARLDLSYGDGPRNRFDLFLPEGTAKGLVVYIHGGYWVRFDKSSWSHLANGALAHGYAVAMPSYTLCPQARISGIVSEVGAAITEAARMIAGPIHLTGHSAGGHLATRMIAATSPLPPKSARASATRCRSRASMISGR